MFIGRNSPVACVACDLRSPQPLSTHKPPFVSYPVSMAVDSGLSPTVTGWAGVAVPVAFVLATVALSPLVAKVHRHRRSPRPQGLQVISDPQYPKFDEVIRRNAAIVNARLGLLHSVLDIPRIPRIL